MRERRRHIKLFQHTLEIREMAVALLIVLHKSMNSSSSIVPLESLSGMRTRISKCPSNHRHSMRSDDERIRDVIARTFRIDQTHQSICMVISDVERVHQLVITTSPSYRYRLSRNVLHLPLKLIGYIQNIHHTRLEDNRIVFQNTLSTSSKGTILFFCALSDHFFVSGFLPRRLILLLLLQFLFLLCSLLWRCQTLVSFCIILLLSLELGFCIHFFLSTFLISLPFSGSFSILKTRRQREKRQNSFWIV